ncbi:hypothetical protein DND132_2011 [Pseudodesulfovibrio mercurii]|uniref:Uncharacterized protein n=1 Tax=Pseudodesulfovibrio mercurii TaxID=641491 RepID=F0JHA2_9BACT|nr:transporter substrate-binding domain-containing protein [Pseudodesulfovibrio mercurii]EGB15217.1 hypothetical protein DND132_2011 [Pseudodesulfovibrio mercurii]
MSYPAHPTTPPRPDRAARRVRQILLAVLILSAPALAAWPSPALAELHGISHRLVFSTFPPGGLRELFDRILTEAYARIGYEVELQSYPAQRALLMANDGLVDGEAGRVSVVEKGYRNLVRVPTPLYVNRIAVLVGEAGMRPAVDPARGWGQFAGCRTCIRNGFKFLESKVEGDGCHKVSSYEKMLELLRNGRVDVGLAEYFDIQPTLGAVGLKGVRILDAPMAANPMYHYLNKKHAALVPLIDAELRSMAEEGRMLAIEHDILREHHVDPASFLPLPELAR